MKATVKSELSEVIGPRPEMITIRFSGWISGRIASFQRDTDIQFYFYAGTGYG